MKQLLQSGIKAFQTLGIGFLESPQLCLQGLERAGRGREGGRERGRGEGGRGRGGEGGREGGGKGGRGRGREGGRGEQRGKEGKRKEYSQCKRRTSVGTTCEQQ